jgi:hypothetical protein
MEYKKIRLKLWVRLEGRCENCGGETVIPPEGEPLLGEAQPDNLATIEHIYGKNHPHRKRVRKEGERRLFLFCRKCNKQKNDIMDQFWNRVYPKTKLLEYKKAEI